MGRLRRDAAGGQPAPQPTAPAWVSLRVGRRTPLSSSTLELGRAPCTRLPLQPTWSASGDRQLSASAPHLRPTGTTYRTARNRNSRSASHSVVCIARSSHSRRSSELRIRLASRSGPRRATSARRRGRKTMSTPMPRMDMSCSARWLLAGLRAGASGSMEENWRRPRIVDFALLLRCASPSPDACRHDVQTTIHHPHSQSPHTFILVQNGITTRAPLAMTRLTDAAAPALHKTTTRRK